MGKKELNKQNEKVRDYLRNKFTYVMIKTNE